MVRYHRYKIIRQTPRFSRSFQYRLEASIKLAKLKNDNKYNKKSGADCLEKKLLDIKKNIPKFQKNILKLTKKGRFTLTLYTNHLPYYNLYQSSKFNSILDMINQLSQESGIENLRLEYNIIKQNVCCQEVDASYKYWLTWT